jgi:hypothetical protein
LVRVPKESKGKVPKRWLIIDRLSSQPWRYRGGVQRFTSEAAAQLYLRESIPPASNAAFVTEEVEYVVTYGDSYLRKD